MCLSDAQLGEADPAAFVDLPIEVLVGIAATIMPPTGFAAPPTEWRDVVHLIAASHLMHAAVMGAVRERIQAVDDLTPSALCSLIRTLLSGGGAARWKPVRPLRAVRAQTPHSVPMHAPPRLSGGSLCALAPGRLCLFGGRDSVSGDTLCGTRLVTLRSSVAIWDDLKCDIHPQARCYHTAVVWSAAPRPRNELPPMFVFGGAGHENLFDDVWKASLYVNIPSATVPAAATPPLTWRLVQPYGSPPTARSSHICAAWDGGRALVVHGGLSVDGVLGDTWLLQPRCEHSHPESEAEPWRICHCLSAGPLLFHPCPDASTAASGPSCTPAAPPSSEPTTPVGSWGILRCSSFPGRTRR